MEHEKPKWMIEHELSDEQHFADIQERMTTLATKDDVKEILEVFKTVKIGWGIFNVSGKTLMWIGGVIVAISLITGAWKAILPIIGISRV